MLAVLAFAACGNDGGDHGADTGPARISTLAYVVTTCDQPPGQGLATFQQALWVRQGDRKPVKIMELPAVPMPFCRTLAETRDGSNSLFAGAFQRMGVSPDGEVVLFEVTYAFSPFRFEPWAKLPEGQEGIFAVRADGTGLRKVARNSQQTDFVLDPACYIPGTVCQGGDPSPGLDISPDRKLVVLTDRGPDENGKMSAQVFTLNVESGERRQIARLPPLPRCGITGAGAPGCNCGNTACQPPACTGSGVSDGIDWGTGSYVFGWTCDPLGTNPTLAGQIFAVRPDGSGLRQLTFARGIVEGADGSLRLELAGPYAVATRLR